MWTVTFYSDNDTHLQCSQRRSQGRIQSRPRSVFHALCPKHMNILGVIVQYDSKDGYLQKISKTSERKGRGAAHPSPSLSPLSPSTSPHRPSPSLYPPMEGTYKERIGTVRVFACFPRALDLKSIENVTFHFSAATIIEPPTQGFFFFFCVQNCSLYRGGFFF